MPEASAGAPPKTSMEATGAINPLTKESPARHIEPGAGIGQWQGKTDGILAYPLKLVGLSVQTHRQSLDLTQMKPVKGNIRLKDVSVIGDGK